MVKIRQIFRFGQILLVIVTFLTISSLVWLVVRDRWKRTLVWSRILTRMSRWICNILGIQVNPLGIEIFRAEKNALLAGNHLSYLDVMVIASNVTTCFVTSVEIKETRGLGHLCMMAGCLFVERRNRASLQKEIGELQEGLQRGLTVTIFPEATSTNGEQILRFRRPLFMAAGMANKPVIPICLNYRTLGGETLTKANRDSIFWYGDMDFLPHLWKLCGIGQAEVDVHFIEVIRPSAQQEPGELAAASQAAVESVFRPIR